MAVSFPPRAARLIDSKRLNRALFGVYFEEDIYEKLGRALPVAMRALPFLIDPAMRARNLIFVHVPRVAGTSIGRALYGRQGSRHHSARVLRTLDPVFFGAARSFAVLRDPFDRFASAFAFVRARGSENCPLAEVFVRDTAKVVSIDDYLSYLEQRDDFSLDFVMRRQSWFVCDLASGEPLVKTLFLYGEDDAALALYLRAHGVTALPWLNRGAGGVPPLSARQRRRVERLYADDFALIEAQRKQRAWEAAGLAPPRDVAAE